MNDLISYSKLLLGIKQRIKQAQTSASIAANSEMILMYWDIGKILFDRQKQEGWGASVIPKLSRDIHNELPEIKGFSERNIGYMIRFSREYEPSILQQTVAKIPDREIFGSIPWGHHLLLIEKIKDLNVRFWYMHQIIKNSWNRNTLALMIKNALHKRQGNVTSNFDKVLEKPQAEMAQLLLKDPYVFDFLTLAQPFAERELETELIRHLEKFLLELGAGFSFLGRQYHLEISSKDIYLDLLFYHIKLRCFVVIELKKGEFKPEYAGKMNFYCSAVDDMLKHPSDQPTIGLILCETKDKVFAEYALRDIHKPIGISEYELTRALPDNLKSSLPSIEEIERELSRSAED